MDEKPWWSDGEQLGMIVATTITLATCALIFVGVAWVAKLVLL